MIKMKVGLDVDLTAYDTLGPWLNWHHRQTGERMDVSVHDSYNLEPKMRREGHDPYQYWRNPKLFSENGVQIEPGVKEMVHALRQNGIEVVVISACNKDHLEDKRTAVARDLPGVEFISRADKWAIPLDVMVDDNPQVHAGFIERRAVGRNFAYQGVFHTGVTDRHFQRDELVMPRGVIRVNCWNRLTQIILNRQQASYAVCQNHMAAIH